MDMDALSEAGVQGIFVGKFSFVGLFTGWLLFGGLFT